MKDPNPCPNYRRYFGKISPSCNCRPCYVYWLMKHGNPAFVLRRAAEYLVGQYPAIIHEVVNKSDDRVAVELLEALTTVVQLTS